MMDLIVTFLKENASKLGAFVKQNSAKLLAPYIVAFASFLAVKAGVHLPAEWAQLVTDATSTLLAATAVSVVGLVERAVAVKTNPHNTAVKPADPGT
jgi:uncharacterized membrane protein YadS